MIAADAALSFIDTNIIVYAIAQDDPVRSHVARSLLERLGEAQTLCVSTQVLQEAFVTLTRKGRRVLNVDQALAALDPIAEFPIVVTDYALVRDAARLSARVSISFWDALIVAAASKVGARTLYTEDLQHGGNILGIDIVNPFRNHEH